MADADFGIRGEATLDTSSAEKSATGLSDKLGDALDKSGQKMSLFASLGKKAADGLTVAIGNFETKIAQAAVQAVQQVVSTGLEFNRQMENYQLAFENLLGSAEAANDALDAIKADAAATPFDVEGLVSANRLLISTGQSAEEAREVINALGNAVSASGGGNDELQRMAANLQQIANVGEAAAIDVKQFAYAGIDIYGLLADYTGKTREEVQGLTISYDLLANALKAASEEGGRYAGAMEAYSQTLQGQMDTLADNATQALGLVTEGVHNALIPIVGDLAATLDEFTSSVDWDAWSLEVQQAVTGAYNVIKTLIDFLLQNGKEVISLITGVASAFATWKIISSVTAAISTLTAAISAAGGLTAALGAVVAAINPVTAVLSVLAGAFGVAYSESEVFRDTVNAAVKSMYDYCSGLLADLADTAANLWSSVTTGTNKNDVRNDPEWLAAQAKNGNTQAGQQLQKVQRRNQAAALQAQADADRDVDWAAVEAYNAKKAAEKASQATVDWSAALDTLSASGAKAAQQTETLADKTEKAMAGLGDSFVYTGSAAQEQASRLAVLEASYNTAQTNVGKYKQLLDDSIASSGAASEMSQYLAQQLEQEENAVESAKKALDAYRDSLDTAKQAARQLEAAQEQLADTWNSGYLKKLQSLAADVLGGNLENALLDAGEIAWQKLDIATRQQLVNLAQSWADTLETAFAQDGFAGLAAAGKTIAESLVAGLQDTSSVTGALLDNVLGQVGISGGVEGLLSTTAELAPLVLGVAAAAAAVSAGVAGVASAFAYTVEQSQALQAKVQELTDAGQALTDELTAALEVLQPVIDLSEEMLASLDRLTSTITDTLTGIGVELMESLLPVLTEIMDTMAPVADSLQPALEAAGDLLRTVLELFGTLVSSALTALQPVLEAVGPLLETLALQLNTIATLVSNFLSPVLKVLGEVLNWLLQPIFWVADAIQAAATFVVNLLNSVLGFFGLKTIDLPDGSAALKGDAFDKVTNALEDNTEAIQEQTDLIRNPPRYQIGGGGPTTGVTDYSAMLAAARAAVLAQNTKAVTNYDAGSGQTTARLNASWKGTSTTVLNLDGREVARAVTPYVDEDMAF